VQVLVAVVEMDDGAHETRTEVTLGGGGGGVPPPLLEPPLPPQPARNSGTTPKTERNAANLPDFIAERA